MQQTPLTEWHREHHGRLVDFAGWEMPMQYTTIMQEHRAVREQAGLFDISHMGRLSIQGTEASQFLDYVTTIDIPSMQPGKIRYALATNEKGGIQDDILVYKQDADFLVVVNASNREKIVASWQAVISKRFEGVSLDDKTQSSGMIALQGPEAIHILTELGCEDLANLKYYWLLHTTLLGSDVLVSRTGYTGEDGFEIIAENDQILPIWNKILEAGQSRGAIACGLGCRDTLRLEAGMPLYGHELSELIDPITAGLKFAVSLKKGDFLGRDVLLEVSENTPENVRVGLKLEGRRIARETSPIMDEDENQIGEVTSGTFSPTLETSIAMGYVPRKFSAIGTKLQVSLRGKFVTASVVELPFYYRNQTRRK
ncbi:MAG: glycine cleavage system aminomethyltransferase GcvT [Planctomycetaceae bacterium]|nr:glycine cleavage system aminomethyltransferase GcvT [Planctomycetaceae bacterium]